MKTSLRPLLLTMTLLALAVTIPLHATDLVWTNVTGGNWNTAANWSPNQVPGAGDRAFITNAGSYAVSITTAATAGDLVLGLDAPGGALLSVQSTLTVPGAWVIGTNGIVDFIGTLAFGSGAITNRGLFNFYSSVLNGPGVFVNEQPGRVYDPPAFGLKYLYRPLINRGTFDRYGLASVIMVQPGAITNDPGGVLNMGGRGFELGGGADATCVIVNRGALNMFSLDPSNPSWIYPPLFNSGTVTVGNTNSLSIYYAYLNAGTNTGVFEVAPNGLMFFIGGVHSLEAGTQLRGSGSLIAGFSGDLVFNTPLTCANQLRVGNNSGSPRVRVNASLTNLNAISVARGELQLLNPASFIEAASFGLSTIFSSVTNAATLAVNSLQLDSGSLLNSGALTVRSNFQFYGGSLYGYGAAQFTTLSNAVTGVISGVGKNLYTTRWANHGTVNLGANDALWFLGSHLVNHAGGVISASGGSALIHNYTVGYTNSFVNHGLFQRGGINGNPSFDLPTTNHGTFNLIGTTITLGAFTQAGGRTDLGGSLVYGARFHVLGGELIGAGNVQSSPSLLNAAHLRPGSPLGTLTLTGPFTNAASGTQHLQIAAFNNYDRVNVSAPVQLAGTLNVTFTNGFFPVIGSTFTALTWTARSGQFDQILTPDYEFEILYTANELLLRASNALPQLAVSAAATQLVCTPFFLSASATDLDGTVTNLTFLRGATQIASVNAASGAVRVLYDFPGVVPFTVTATDDRGGQKTIVTNLIYVTLPLHTINLGGFFETNTAFKLCMLGETGSNYVVQAAELFSNPVVTNWHDLGTMTYSNGIFLYRDHDATNFPMRFYRTRQEP